MPSFEVFMKYRIKVPHFKKKSVLCSCFRSGLQLILKRNIDSNNRATINVRSNLTKLNIPINNFPDSSNSESNDQSMTNQINQHSIPYIPTILSANVRVIVTKVDEIQQVSELNSIDIICITETWLSPNIPDL